MKTLRPILDRPFYHEHASGQLERHWYDVLFRPIYDLLRSKLGVRHNSTTMLRRALIGGKVQWYDGFFTGPFSASVSKEIRAMGGTWNKSKKAFELPLARMSIDIKAAISGGHARVNDAIGQIYAHLDWLEQSREKTSIDFEPSFEKVVKGLDKQFVETVRASENIAVQPFVSEADKKRLADKYTAELNHFADNFTKEEVWKLRDLVNKSVMDGFRSDTLVKRLESEFGVTRRKAKFLARQETSLMISKYRQTRYEAIGLTRYKWSTSHDERVRQDHKELNGRVFAYAEPPITDKATGAKNNPGEDFNCRCVAIPILEN